MRSASLPSAEKPATRVYKAGSGADASGPDAKRGGSPEGSLKSGAGPPRGANGAWTSLEHPTENASAEPATSNATNHTRSFFISLFSLSDVQDSSHLPSTTGWRGQTDSRGTSDTSVGCLHRSGQGAGNFARDWQFNLSAVGLLPRLPQETLSLGRRLPPGTH